MKNKIIAGLAALTFALSSVYGLGCSSEVDDCSQLLQSSSSLKSKPYEVHKSMLQSPYETMCPAGCTYLGETPEKYCCECPDEN